MWKQRVIYAVALTGAALFLVLYPLWFSWYLMVTLLLLAVLDIIISLPGMLAGKVFLAAPKVLEQSDDAAQALTILRSKQFPVNCIKVRVKITSEDRFARQLFIVKSENNSRYEVKIDTSHSGVTAFEIKRLWTVSLMGLFCIPAVVKKRVSVLILPPPSKPPHTLALPQGILLRPKPGGGFSDDHDLRPFRRGDSIRNVHWKVSAKLDSLVIREPLTPLSHNRLIQVSGWTGAAERDLVLGRLLWVSDYLLKWGLHHYVSLDSYGCCAQVTGISDLHDCLHTVLDSTSDSSQYNASAPAGFTWVFQIDKETI